MQMRFVRTLTGIVGALALLVFAGACRKKTVTTPPAVPTPPAAAVPRPTVTLQASPSFIQQGQSSTLTWNSTDATKLDLQPGVGSVSAQGSTQVSPTESTTYTVTATGPGGTADASTRITISAGAVAQPNKETPETLEEMFARNVQDAFFDYDKSDIRPDAREALSRDAEFLRTHPNLKITVEGHCDERGSEEYNLGLGQRRSDAAKEFLVSLGVSASQLTTMSWGKERPFCTEHDEGCWQKNRRAHFIMAR